MYSYFVFVCGVVYVLRRIVRVMLDKLHKITL